MTQPLRRVRIGSRVQVLVERLDPSGLGVATVELAGRPVELLVEDGLPGDEGELLVTYAGRTPVGRLMRREVSAETRRTDLPCARWTPRSPCRLMHLEGIAQRQFKQQRLRETFGKAGVSVEVAPVRTPSSALGWRVSASFVAAKGNNGLVLGAYQRGTHLVQPMESCPLHDQPVIAVANALRDALREANTPLYDSQLPVSLDHACGGPRGKGPLLRDAEAGKPKPYTPHTHSEGLRYVVIRTGYLGEVVVALLTPSGQLEGAEALAEALRGWEPCVVGVFVGASGPGDVIFGKEALRPLGDSALLGEQLGGQQFQLSPKAFFQVNRVAAEALHEVAAKAAGGGRILELYSGAGALTLRLAQEAALVLGIERVGEAVQNARAAAALSTLGSLVHFVEADAAATLQRLLALRGSPDETLVATEDAIAAIASGTATDLAAEADSDALLAKFAAGRLDAVVVNPPRKGCARPVIDAIAALEPTRIVYISCSPDSLARDLALLQDAGYEAQSSVPIDLFPQSEHIESVTLMTRKET